MSVEGEPGQMIGQPVSDRRRFFLVCYYHRGVDAHNRLNNVHAYALVLGNKHS